MNRGHWENTAKSPVGAAADADEANARLDSETSAIVSRSKRRRRPATWRRLSIVVNPYLC